MFIQTETTPNPATLKFLPGKVVMETGNADFRSADDAMVSPLATRLFAVPGVEAVFFGYDFVAVTKNDAEWQHLKPAILGAIMEHFMSGAPVMATAAPELDTDSGEEFFDTGDETIVATIKELLETRVRPAVAQDGGDITFRGYREGTVFLNMKGACSGCPSSTATLKHGVQNLLHHFVPEVEHVEAV
ncbi:NifU family protein [Martelella mediterranea]|uniref:Fe-S cluster biogenesis protein NfuA n=1 Tax=Martelella mediterranea TaxID=293089 RepID=A0A4R3NW71_9HYPH|nr:NifU family protein [Martelella mediterranea]TCT43038.1 Fe-S cluster biogenesis protein NfuA [Martelella mediterranea]